MRYSLSEKKKHIGSSFDDFLAEENMLEESEAVAIKRVIAHQIEAVMKKKHLTKTVLAQKMHTSRSALERLFDPERSDDAVPPEAAAYLFGTE